MISIFKYIVSVSAFLFLPLCSVFSGNIDTNAVSYLNYVQNKGQWHSNVKFQAGFRGGTVYLEKNAFTYVFYPAGGVDTFHHPSSTPFSTSFHAVQMSFENGLPESEITTAGKQSYYSNYFIGNDPGKWAKEVPAYNTVWYKNKYEGISVKTFGEGNNVRYDFIAAPGADIGNIRLKFTGQDALKLQNGNLIITTAVGDITQKAPFAYQIENGKIKTVECNYVLEKDVLGFKISGNYNKSLPLTIDPTLVFATFSGSTADNWGMTATYDDQGNGYTAGITFAGGYPTTAGAFQAGFGGGITDAVFPFGGFDITVSKFNATGNTLLYATYLGGYHNEMPVSIIADNSSNLLVLGKTYSNNYPVTSGVYDNSYNGGSDIIISKLNSNGTALIASTFIGGALDDGVNIDAYEPTLASLKHNYADDGRGGILLDNNNNVYVGTCTKSTDFPVTAGCIQPVNAGMQDACVFKMTPNLNSLVFSTYLGGTQNDAAYNIALDSKNRLYVTGGTESSGFPVTAGALHTTYAGQIDGFVSHFNFSGNALLHSTYIGTAAYDQSYFVQTDKLDGVYLYGQTRGGYPVSAGVYSNPNSGQFIHKLDSGLSVSLFSTVLGNSTFAPNLVPSAFLVDNCQNIYISGWGGPLATYFNSPTISTAGLPTTPDAFQGTTDGSDFYFLVLNKNAVTLKYATYFGGSTISEHVDGGTSRFDKTGAIYQGICGGCGGQSGMPTTPGAWSNTNASGNCNNALVKFSFDMEITVAQLNTNPINASGCAPLSVDFLNSSINSVHYQWFFGDGASSNLAEPSHVYVDPGTYEVMLIATDSSTCNITDTTYTQIIVAPPILIDPMPLIELCKGDTFHLNAVSAGALTYTWTPSVGLNNAGIANPSGIAVGSQTYTITVSNDICSVSDSVKVQVNENTLSVSMDVSQLCSNAPTQLSADTIYANYLWYNGQTGAQVTITQPGVYYLETIDFDGCKATDSIEVIAYEYVDVIGYDTVMCTGSSIVLQTTEGEYTYNWLPSASLSDGHIFNPVASPTVTTVYTVSITSGPCTTTDSIRLNVLPIPFVNASPEVITVLPGEQVDMLAYADTVVYWSPPRELSCDVCNYTVATPDTIMTYYATVYNEFGCSATDSVKVWVSPVLYIPNAFTPNADHLNAIFRPVCIGYVSIEVFIFNRWGEQIYKWNTFEGGWDGTYEGKKVQQDVYIYKLRAIDYMDNEIEKAGTVTLIR